MTVPSDLICFGFFAEQQPLKRTNERVLRAWNNRLMLGGKFPKTRQMLGVNLGDAGWKLYGEVRNGQHV